MSTRLKQRAVIEFLSAENAIHKMADGSVLCNFNSECFPHVSVQDPSKLYLSSEALKCVIKTQDELKSAWLIIELLVNEVNTLKACSGARLSDRKTEDTKPDDFHKWILVKQAHSNSQKRNPTIQSKNLITLTNSFEVLGNLDDASEKATPNLTMAPKTSCVQKQRQHTSKKHSVILMGDSHVRGIAERLSINLGSSFNTTGCVKRNTTLSYIMSSEISALSELSKSDVVVLCGGTMDIARNDSRQGLASISRFVENLDHTNVVAVDAPHRFDLDTSSCINKEVIAFNRKLEKILKPHNMLVG
jgi:hypothetical protein